MYAFVCVCVRVCECVSRLRLANPLPSRVFSSGVIQAVTIDTSQVAPALRNYLPTPPAPLGSTSSSGTSPAPATVTVVAAEVSSADPHATAQEIGKRLLVRLGSDGDSLQACPMS